MMHVRSSNGLIPGAEHAYKTSTIVRDYHDQMKFNNFQTWILEKLS